MHVLDSFNLAWTRELYFSVNKCLTVQLVIFNFTVFYVLWWLSGMF